ncbi:MAG: tripartite tricarboxylate transporter substrate binding protein [Vicinamibacterales bacterium]
MTSRGVWLAVCLTTAAAGCSPSAPAVPVVMLTTHSSPGGGSDVFLRELAPHLGRYLEATFVVENVQGGSGAKAMAALAQATPDGRTFYATTPTFVYTSLLSQPAVTYRELEPIVNIFFDPEVVYTAAGSPYESLGDVIARARQGGGRWGAANPASLERQTLERIKQLTGVTAAIATFEGGGDMMLNVLNGTLDMGIGELQELRGQLEAGNIRLLAVIGDERLTQLPEVPTAREQGVDLAVRKFRGVAGPKGTPPDVIAEWERAVPQLLADAAYQKIYLANNLQPGFMPHEDYVKFIDGFGRETIQFLKQSGVIQ